MASDCLRLPADLVPKELGIVDCKIIAVLVEGTLANLDFEVDYAANNEIPSETVNNILVTSVLFVASSASLSTVSVSLNLNLLPS